MDDDDFVRSAVSRALNRTGGFAVIPAAAIPPLITLIGAIAGVSNFGLLGLLIGPLALSYLFELIRMYREEYLEPEVGG